MGLRDRIAGDGAKRSHGGDGAKSYPSHLHLKKYAIWNRSCSELFIALKTSIKLDYIPAYFNMSELIINQEF